MTDLLRPDDGAGPCPQAAGEPCFDAYEARATQLGGGLTIRRALPLKGRRTVGAWCFLDHFGPLQLGPGGGVDVAPHPHIGLQTVTWLIEGAMQHSDSIGCERLIRPGQLNLMTAGRGIAHSEVSPKDLVGTMHGVQYWIALPAADREVDPAFEHHPELPEFTAGDAELTLLVGEYYGIRSPATIYSSLIGLDLVIPGGEAPLVLNPEHEHAVVVLEGEVTVGEQVLGPGHLYYLGVGRDRIRMEAADAARLTVVGGEPLNEDILLWWNFVARSWDEIRVAAERWQTSEYFGNVASYPGARLEAPPIP